MTLLSRAAAEAGITEEQARKLVTYLAKNPSEEIKRIIYSPEVKVRFGYRAEFCGLLIKAALMAVVEET